MGSDESSTEYDSLRDVFYKILMSGAVLGALVFILVVSWVLYYGYGYNGGGFNWDDPAGSINIHIVVMVFFMVYLHGHASIIYRILPTLPKYRAKLIHASMHLIVCIGTGIGLAAAVRSHNLKASPHFYTLHSWIGITTISLYYLQFLGGFLSFLLPVTPMNFRIAVLPYHRFVGQSLLTLASGAAITGLMLKAFSALGNQYPTLPPAAIVLNSAGLGVVLFSLAIGTMLNDHRFRRRPRPGPEGELLLHQARNIEGDTDTDHAE